MPPQDRLVIPPVVVIGPVSVGKSTIGGLLADRLGWPHVSMDAVCAAYSPRSASTERFRATANGHMA